MTRKVGLVMSSPERLIDPQVPVEEVHKGRVDTVKLGTTQLERFVNHQTVANASEWLFHHPGDEKFVPKDLPEPTPVTIAMSGGGQKFDGQPWFRPSEDA